MRLTPAEWLRALDALDEALAQPEPARADWLAAQALPAAVAAQVQRLLADRRALETGEFLDKLPDAVHEAAHQAALLAQTADEATAGAHFGPYRLVRELGRGGMSHVWLAERDDGQARRDVAIKLPHTGSERSVLARRLLRERDLLAALEHPHIARLYDIGVSPQGTPFMVLEYVHGESLPEHCRTHRLGIAARLNLFLQVLRAVQHAHTKLVLHRDLKPSNILVNDAGDVKLLDFGIAKPLHEAGVGDSALTQMGGRALTPDYAAPEQILGQPLGTASDVYALGVLLFELLTDQRPYRLQRDSRGALEQAILEAEPPLASDTWGRARSAAVDPSQRAAGFGATPQALRRALQGDLDAIIAAALRKDPGARTESADALAQDIQRHLAHEPVRSRAPSRPYRAARFVRRHLVGVSATALVSGALATGAGLALWQAGVARGEAARAVAIRDFLVALFRSNSLDQADALARRQRSVQQLLEDSADSLSNGLAEQPVLRAELQSVVGDLLHDLALTDRAEQVRRERVAQLRALPSDPPRLAQALDDLARSQHARGVTDSARAHWLEASALLASQRGGAAVRQRMGIELALAGLDLDTARVAEAARRIDTAVAALATLGTDTVDQADALSVQARLRHDQGRMAEVPVLLQRALDIALRVHRDQPAQLARWRYRHAREVWSLLGRADLAEPHLRAASALMRGVAGADSVNTALIDQELGRAQLDMGRMTPAQATLSEARRVLQMHAAQVDPAYLRQAALLQAEAALANGRLDLAQAALAGLQTPMPSAAGADIDTVATAENPAEWPLYTALVISSVQMQTGHFDPAQRTLAAWLGWLRAHYGATVPSVVDVRLRQAALDQARGDSAQALARVDTLLAEAGFGDVPAPLRAAVRSQQASLQMDLGRFDQALPTARALFADMAATPESQRSASAEAAAHNRLARALLGSGDAPQACPHYAQAVARLAQLDNDDNPYLAATRADQARCLAALGDATQARRLLAQAEASLRTQPDAGPQFHLPVQQAREALLRGPPSKALSAQATPVSSPTHTR